MQVINNFGFIKPASGRDIKWTCSRTNQPSIFQLALITSVLKNNNKKNVYKVTLHQLLGTHTNRITNQEQLLQRDSNEW